MVVTAVPFENVAVAHHVCLSSLYVHGGGQDRRARQRRKPASACGQLHKAESTSATAASVAQRYMRFLRGRESSGAGGPSRLPSLSRRPGMCNMMWLLFCAIDSCRAREPGSADGNRLLCSRAPNPNGPVAGDREEAPAVTA